MARIAHDVEIEVLAEKLDNGRMTMRPTQPLPPICIRHGQPASDRYGVSVAFHRVGTECVQTTLTSTLWWALRHLSRMPPPTAVDLFVEWPICPRCRRERRWLRMSAAALVLSGAVSLLALLVGGYLGAFTPPQSPWLGLAFIPLWFPGLIAVAGAAYGRATRYARIRPIVDDTRIALRAHPRFAAVFRR